MKKAVKDEAVEREIAELLEDKDVLLAKAEQRVKYRRRQYMYKLRSLQRRGKQLRESGITKEALTTIIDNTDDIMQDIEK